MKIKKPYAIAIICLSAANIGSIALSSAAKPNEEAEAWEASQIKKAEILAKKESGTLLGVADTELEPLSINDEEKEAARKRYYEIQDAIEKLNAKIIGRKPTESENLELIKLGDEALDLSHRYELFHTVTEEEKLQSWIDTLALEGSFAGYFKSQLEAETSEKHLNGWRYRLFLSESYGSLASVMQDRWGKGESIESLNKYCGEQVKQILKRG